MSSMAGAESGVSSYPPHICVVPAHTAMPSSQIMSGVQLCVPLWLFARSTSKKSGGGADVMMLLAVAVVEVRVGITRGSAMGVSCAPYPPASAR